MKIKICCWWQEGKHTRTDTNAREELEIIMGEGEKRANHHTQINKQIKTKQNMYKMPYDTWTENRKFNKFQTLEIDTAFEWYVRLYARYTLSLYVDGYLSKKKKISVSAHSVSAHSVSACSIICVKCIARITRKGLFDFYATIYAFRFLRP